MSLCECQFLENNEKKKKQHETSKDHENNKKVSRCWMEKCNIPIMRYRYLTNSEAAERQTENYADSSRPVD